MKRIMWAVIISLLVLGLAFLLDRMGLQVLEEPSPFMIAIGVFFVIYVVAAFAVGHFTTVMAQDAGLIPLSAIRN